MNLELCLDDFYRNNMLILVEYMNAKVGSETTEEVVGALGVLGSNRSGNALVDACASKNLRVMNARFRRKRMCMYTFTQVRRAGEKNVEYQDARIKFKKWVLGCVVDEKQDYQISLL